MGQRLPSSWHTLPFRALLFCLQLNVCCSYVGNMKLKKLHLHCKFYFKLTGVGATIVKHNMHVHPILTC
jgi:hypothetical protein